MKFQLHPIIYRVKGGRKRRKGEEEEGGRKKRKGERCFQADCEGYQPHSSEIIWG